MSGSPDPRGVLGMIAVPGSVRDPIIGALWWQLGTYHVDMLI